MTALLARTPTTWDPAWIPTKPPPPPPPACARHYPTEETR